MRTVVVGLAKILDFWIYTNDKKKKLFDFGKDREEGFGKNKNKAYKTINYIFFV